MSDEIVRHTHVMTRKTLISLRRCADRIGVEPLHLFNLCEMGKLASAKKHGGAGWYVDESETLRALQDYPPLVSMKVDAEAELRKRVDFLEAYASELEADNVRLAAALDVQRTLLP